MLLPKHAPHTTTVSNALEGEGESQGQGQGQGGGFVSISRADPKYVEERFDSTYTTEDANAEALG